MRLLGAVLAGGVRHADEVADAIAAVADALGAQCAGVVAVGRHGTALPFVADQPGAGLGPIGGLAGALAAAQEAGFDAVVTAGIDGVPPGDLTVRLGLPNAVAWRQPLWGLWHAGLAQPLSNYLKAGGERSIDAWVFATQARRVQV